MKKFISKNWKNIFLIIGGIFIIVDLFFIITTPANVPQDFLEYGPEVESDIFDGMSNISEEIKDINGSGEIVSDVSNQTGLSPELSKGLLVIGVGLIIIFAISAITDGSGSSDKKKK